MAAAGLLIGALARDAGCPVETVRYYEREGLLPEPGRSPGGQRIYEEEHRRRLLFVRRARGLGFPLDHVRTLLKLVDMDADACCEARKLAEVRLAEVEAKLADLKKIERSLRAVVSGGSAAPGCPLLDCLSGDPVEGCCS